MRAWVTMKESSSKCGLTIESKGIVSIYHLGSKSDNDPKIDQYVLNLSICP